MANNVVEILLKAKDQTQAVFGKFRDNLTSVKTLVAGVFAAAAVGGLARKFINETEEAEKSLALLRNALQNVGPAAKTSEKDLLAQATAIQTVTRFSDEAVQQTQALLLRIGLTGDALKRATQNTADFAEAMQTDMVGAARTVGRALNDPVQGLTMLRRQGIAFTADQQAMIKALVESGQKAQAQAMVFDALEKKFKGAAEAGGNTLGGAMAKLKNAFGELFEVGTKDSGKVVKGINDITSALQAPETKKAIDTLAGWFAGLFSSIITGAAKAVNAVSGVVTGPGLDLQISELQKKIAAARSGRQVGRGGRTDADTETVARRNRAGVAVNAAAMEEDLARLLRLRERLSLEPVTIIGEAAVKKTQEQVATILEEIQLIGVAAKGAVAADPIKEMFAAMEEDTRTSVQRISGDLDVFRAKLEALQKEGILTKAQAQDRLKAKLDDTLPEFDLQKIRDLKKPVQAELTELSQFTIGVFRRMGESISQSFSDALYEGKFSMQTLKDIVRRGLADLGATILSSGVKEAFTSLFKGSTSGGGGGGSSGFNWGKALTTVASFFGFAAGGSDKISKPTAVGEELIMPSDASRVFNQRQLAFKAANGMGGAQVNYAPQYTITIQAQDGDKTKTALVQYLETRLAEDRAELARDMERNGMGVLR